MKVFVLDFSGNLILSQLSQSYRNKQGEEMTKCQKGENWQTTRLSER